MIKDKLKFKSDIQRDFENATIKEIEFAIKFSKIMRTLYQESTMFLFTFLPTAAILAYERSIILTIIGILVHFILFKFLFKKTILKGCPKELEEMSYTVEILEDLRLERLGK
jgi:hypothetical protein